MFVKRKSSYVVLGICFFATVAFHRRTAGLPVGPRAPDAASGSSVDSRVYLNRGGEVHGGEDGASKYINMGQDPKPAEVDGAPKQEIKLTVDAQNRETLPKPAHPMVASERHLLWLGFGGAKVASATPGIADNQDHQGGGTDKKKDRGLDTVGNKAEKEQPINKADPQGGEDGSEEEGTFGDEEHIWHEDEQEHEEEGGDSEYAGDEGHPAEHDDADTAADDHGVNEGGTYYEAEDTDAAVDDDDGDVIHTYGEITDVADQLRDEYQQKSLELKEHLTDDEGRRRAATKLQANIDGVVDQLIVMSRDGKVRMDGGDTEGFLGRMLQARESAKKRVRDILLGGSIHFDTDDL